MEGLESALLNDSEKSNLSANVLCVQKKESNKNHGRRKSSRKVKANAPQEANFETDVGSTKNNPVSKSGSRKWETWKNDDTKWFFEALSEHGKDFGAIQMYMALRFEKKIPPSQEPVKNREQVRHYYYRTWHKISSSINFPDCNYYFIIMIIMIIKLLYFNSLIKLIVYILHIHKQKVLRVLFSNVSKVCKKGNDYS